jgi:hypothetical protein
MKYELITGVSSFADAMTTFSKRFGNESELHMYIMDFDLNGLAITRPDGAVQECQFIDMPSSFWPKRARGPKKIRP